MKRFFAAICLFVAYLSFSPTTARADEAVFVEGGRIKAACWEGEPWQQVKGYIECKGMNNVIFAAKRCGRGDFHVTVELTLGNLGHTAASIQFGGSHFGFDGKNDRLFVQGKLFGPTKHLGKRADFFSPDKPFLFEAIRKGDTIRFLIDGKQAHKIKYGGELGRMGLRPWRAKMRVSRFAAEGNLLDAPCPVPRTQPDAYTIPTIDLSHQKHRQVVVERIPGKYLGHPTTVLMDDGKTIYCTYPLGHGGPAAVLKKSSDGGLTWSGRLPLPDNWKTAKNCPCLHRLADPAGKERLFVFEGNGAMRQAYSEDGGKTWTPFKPNELHCVVAPITIVPIAGKRHLAMYHRGRGDRDRPPLELWQAVSSDGGLTWTDERKVADYPAGNPCEPFVIRSPDGKQLAALARENARRYNSLLIISNDEGKTWSKPVELPASLTGDRHMGRYAADGRLVLCFRDTTLISPTRGDFVAWVGTYDDIVNLREGQYRVRLLRSPKKGDLGYPGVELLPDGTFVATTYAVLAPGEKNSVVSVRFKLSEIDAEAKRLPAEENLFVSGKNGYDTYRIPALAVTNKGSVLAFCEGRKKSRSDTGDIDMLLRRSTDGGRTFSKQQIVWDDGPNTCGNPCPVVDRETGTIWLLMTHNLGEDRESQIKARTSKGTRSVWASNSTDDGRTWSKPKDITATTKKPNWTWYATGPGAGIQLRDGRLIIPCDHMVAVSEGYNSHIIYSDDHGKTWRLGGTATPAVNECEVVELADGRLMLNMRNYNRKFRARAVATSNDRGMTWSKVTHDPVLVEPICQASFRRYSTAKSGGKNRLLFSNPGETNQRKEMTVRMSLDEGKTWTHSRVLYAGPAAYSCLAVLPDGEILCLYERGLKRPYETITLARFGLEWLEEPDFARAPTYSGSPIERK